MSECEGLGHYCTLVDFIKTVHFGYTKFIKQYKIKSSTKKMMQLRDSVNTRYEAAASVAAYCLTANFFFFNK